MTRAILDGVLRVASAVVGVVMLLGVPILVGYVVPGDAGPPVTCAATIGMLVLAYGTRP